MSNKTLAIIGAGAAGMMAAIAAADAGFPGDHILLFDHNEKAGKKIFITGKGRCNITNGCEKEDFFNNVKRNLKFLYSAFYLFDNDAVIDFFESEGLKTKLERGNRYFPLSDKSSDVIKALTNALEKRKINLILNTKVTEILTAEGHIVGLKTEGKKKREYKCDALIIATGGKSYQSTGSTGDGYNFAKKLGHSIVEIMPSLIPFNAKMMCNGKDILPELQGLSLKNAAIRIMQDKKCLYEDFGEMLFTHFGVSGPMILSASADCGDKINKSKDIKLFLDLKPALDKEALDKRLLRDFEENKNKSFKNIVASLVPGKLAPVIIKLTGIDENKKINEITKAEREKIVLSLKEIEIKIEGLRDINEAIITRGGVSVKEVSSSTMESKLVEGLYFAGEVLDLDAYTGGFNLQIAWSTGHLAGVNAAEKLKGEI